MTVVVALVFDIALVLLGRLIMPWTRGARAPRLEREPMGA